MGRQSRLPESQDEFDPYHMWLGIPPKDQPPHHYRLLGIEVFEDNADVVDTAANRHTSYLHDIATGPHRTESQRLLNEIAAARRCLLDRERKTAYDEKLKAELAKSEPEIEEAEEDFGAELEEALDAVLEEQANAPDPMTRMPPPQTRGQRRKSAKKSSSEQVVWPIWAGVGLSLLLLVVLIVWLASDNSESDTMLVAGSNPNSTVETNPGSNPATDTQSVKSSSAPGDQSAPGDAVTDTTANPKQTPTDIDTSSPPKVASSEPKTPSPPKISSSPANTSSPPKETTGVPAPKPPAPNPDDVKPSIESNGSDEKPKNPQPGPRPETTRFVRLKPDSVRSSRLSTTLEVQSKDQSVLAKSNDRSKPQTYTVTAETDIKTITAFRLWALPDKSLSKSRFGPGLGSNGMFSLTEFKVTVAPKSSPDQSKPVVFKRVIADFGRDSANGSIDGDVNTGWTVSDRPNEKRMITFLLKEPLTLDEPVILTFQLEQAVGLGRFQLFVSGMRDQKKLAKIPPPKLPLYVNLGGEKDEVIEGRLWVRSRPYESGPYGHDAGTEKLQREFSFKAANSCVEGLQNFRVDVPKGRYTVTLFFCDCWVKLPGGRVFSVEVEDQPVTGVTGLDLVRHFGFRKPNSLPPINVEVNDGVLDVVFKRKPGKRPPILNAIAIEKQQEPEKGKPSAGSKSSGLKKSRGRKK